MRILSFNVNGIRAAHRKGVLDWFQIYAPDILCVQETKANPEQLAADITDIEGYQSHWEWSRARKGYSGVAVYTKQEPEKIERGLGIERFDIEGRTLLLHYPSFVLYNIYFPNGQKDDERLQYKLDFYDAFLEHANRMRDSGKNLVMCGDYNTAHKEIDLAHPKENEKHSGFLPVERQWLDRYVADGYIDTFRMFDTDGENYTWWDMKSRARDRNVGWRIDYFFVSESLRDTVENAFILPDVMGSDHCPVGIELAV